MNGQGRVELGNGASAGQPGVPGEAAGETGARAGGVTHAGAEPASVAHGRGETASVAHGRRRGDDIAERLLDLAAGVLKLLPALSRQPSALCLVRQLERCGPAGGANYEEARGAESPADFVHKLRIALKELRETHYWLRLALRAGLVEPPTHSPTARTAQASSPDVHHLIAEADQLIAILTASATTARRRTRP